MKKDLLPQILLFVLLVILQIGLFNRIHLFGFATPLIYIYFVLKLPVDMNRNLVLILSAWMGFIIDIFGYTLGLHMLTMVIIGFSRHYFLKLFATKDIFGKYTPSLATFGKFLFIRYVCTLTIFHHFLLYSFESFSLFNPLLLILRILSSFILSILLIFAFENTKLDVFTK